MTAIVLNGVCVVVEELARSDENEFDPAWLILELSFSVIFTVEAIIKIAHSPCGYFRDFWNRFDFFLVLCGIVGGTMSTVEFMNNQEGSEAQALSEASRASRIIRIARILRSTRLLRLFILLHAMIDPDKHASQEIAESMLKLQTLTSFAQAHIEAQKQMKKFFVGDCANMQEVEIARCILQSLVSVHKALVQIVAVQRKMETALLDDLQAHKETKRITEHLEEFVQDAEESGAISAQEAHSILHPMHELLATSMRFINTLDDGVVDKETHSGWKTPKTPDLGTKSEDRDNGHFELDMMDIPLDAKERHTHEVAPFLSEQRNADTETTVSI